MHINKKLILFNNNKNNNNNKFKHNNMTHWYNRVYLCINTSLCEWTIKKFDSFELADKYYNDTTKSDKLVNTTILPICKFIPSWNWIDKYIIKQKLVDMYINIKIDE